MIIPHLDKSHLPDTLAFDDYAIDYGDPRVLREARNSSSHRITTTESGITLGHIPEICEPTAQANVQTSTSTLYFNPIFQQRPAVQSQVTRESQQRLDWLLYNLYQRGVIDSEQVQVLQSDFSGVPFTIVNATAGTVDVGNAEDRKTQLRLYYQEGGENDRWF